MSGISYSSRDIVPGSGFKDLNSILSIADEYAYKGLDVNKDDGSCISSGMTAKKTAISNLNLAYQLYKEWLNISETHADKYGREKVELASLKVLSASASLVRELKLCLIKDGNGEIDEIIKQQRLLDQRDNANANIDESKLSEDDRVRRKILATIVKNGCGFRSFKDYAGGESYEDIITEAAVNPFLYPNTMGEEEGENINKIYGLLLFGPPGTGKTLLVESAAQKLEGVTFMSISPAAIKGSYVGETARSIRVLFEEARKATNGGTKPVLVFIDEVDGIIGEGKKGNDAVAQMNIEMEGIGKQNKGIILIMATNFPAKMADAILSRCKTFVYVGHPLMEDIREFLFKKFEKLGRARHTLDIDMSRPRKINTPKSEDAIDDLDKLVLRIFAQKKYVNREVDAVWLAARLLARKRAIQFLTKPMPNGANKQRWLVDKTKFKVKKNEGNSCKEVEVTRHGFVPIGTSGTQVYKSEAKDPAQIGDWESDLQNPNIFRVITNRREKKLNDKQSYFEYETIAREEIVSETTDKNGKKIAKKEWKYIDSGKESIQNIASLVTISQLGFDDFIEALGMVQPTKISNIPELLEFATNYKASNKKLIPVKGMSKLVPADIFILYELLSNGQGNSSDDNGYSQLTKQYGQQALDDLDDGIERINL